MVMFSQIIKKAPPIHVYSKGQGKRHDVKIGPWTCDRTYHHDCFGRDKTMGKGTYQNPYRYAMGASRVSPHYQVVDLWFRYRSPGSDWVYIQVGDYIFQLFPVGVRAEDGEYTVLLN